MDLARGFNIIPPIIGNTGVGDVWQYDYDDGIRYRFIADDLSADDFYSSWDGSIVSGLVATKKITLG